MDYRVIDCKVDVRGGSIYYGGLLLWEGGWLNTKSKFISSKVAQRQCDFY